MSVSLPEQPPLAPSEPVFNVPNQITISRFVLAIVCFVLIGLGHYIAGMIVFLVAVSTDWVDGYYARRYKQVTQLGRNLDPFVDKVIICGTYIFLAAEPNSHVKAWMVVVVVGRELLVTALRSFLEQQGSDFSAAYSGKLKFVFQCVVAALSLKAITYPLLPEPQAAPKWLAYSLDISILLMIVMTVYSGAAYIVVAARLLRK